MKQDQATLEPEVRLAPSRYITIALAAAITGFSPGAIRTKIARGVWIEGREYLRAPDGHVAYFSDRGRLFQSDRAR